MQQNSRFYAIKKYGFSSNIAIVHDLYTPIIGNQAALLYFNLLREVDRQKQIMNTSTSLNEYLKTINFNLEDFNHNRRILEAIGLISTYLEQDNERNIYTLAINEPLNFKNFIANTKYRHLLIKAIGQNNYDKLEFLHNSTRISSNATNISAPFTSVFNDLETQAVSNINFEELYVKMAKTTSLPIVISNECKQLIESYFKGYDLSMNEIEKIIYSSILLIDNKNYEIDIDLLNMGFQKHINAYHNVNVLQNIKLNRNNKIFIHYYQKQELAQIFSDYMALNCYHYLRAIVKTKLTEEQVHILDTLKNKYLITDFIINMLVDYTLFKTNGELNQKYIYKVAKSINANNLKSLQAIYDYFHFRNNTTQTEEKQESDSLITWEEVK
ncbi:MAG: DnaD domain protein [Mycoplasmataceae bacterium]|nr:DnaD domain protein [Mycoplasmataceae bacterium]